MKKILPYFKPYKVQSLLGPLFKLLEATFELVVPFIVALIVDKGLGARVDGGYPYADKSYIAIMCAVLGGFGLVGLVCAVTAQYFAAKAATGVSTQLRKALFAKLQSLSYSDMDTLGTSAMLTRMTNDVNQLQSGINMVLRLFLRSPFIVFGAMIMAFFIDRHSALVFVGTIPVLSAVVFAVMLVCMPLYKKSQGKLDKVLLSTRENLTGARVLRAFCKEDDEKRLFAERNGELTKSQKFVGGISALMNPLTYALINGAIIVLIYVGALRVDHGNLSQGSVLALYNLMTQILVELIKLANLIITVTKAAACGSRIEGVLDMESSLKLLPAGEENTSAGGKGEGSIVSESGETLQAFVEFDRVSMPHFYDVTEGSVRVAGKDVRAYDPKVLRDKIGVVPQKAVLFKGTIRENLQWGKADATDEELMAAARAAQADKVIEDKGGLDAPVEQGGRNFSGGQKQRLTIARALVRRPEILILDDSASALDYATDAALRRALKELDYAPTVFVVSQRTSAMNGADKIVVLDEGRAAGIGTHEELLKDCPVYREIYESQHKKEGGERRAEA